MKSDLHLALEPLALRDPADEAKEFIRWFEHLTVQIEQCQESPRIDTKTPVKLVEK